LKTQVFRFVAAVIIALLCHVSSARASSLDDLLANPPRPKQTYTHGVTNSGQSLYTAPAQYRAAARRVGPADRADAAAAPRASSPGTLYQQPVAQTRANPQHVNASKPSSRNKATQSTATKSGLASVTTYPASQQPNARPTYSYQPTYPSQPRNVSGQRYSRQSPSGYYQNSYQNGYAPPRNYYQGYSYNTWGSSGQACAPGRA